MSKRSFSALNRDKKSQEKKKRTNHNKHQSDEDGTDDELMPKAFPVEGNPIPPGSKQHENANEYLLQVRWESNLYGENFVATNLDNAEQLPVKHDYGPTSYLFQYFATESNLKTQPFTEVSEDWKQKVVQVFVKVKEVNIHS